MEALLATASFFDVAPLATAVSDWVFCALSTTTAVRFVNMVVNCEYGEPGKVRPARARSAVWSGCIGDPLATLQCSVQLQPATTPPLDLYCCRHRTMRVRNALAGRCH